MWRILKELLVVFVCCLFVGAFTRAIYSGLVGMAGKASPEIASIILAIVIMLPINLGVAIYSGRHLRINLPCHYLLAAVTPALAYYLVLPTATKVNLAVLLIIVAACFVGSKWGSVSNA